MNKTDYKNKSNEIANQETERLVGVPISKAIIALVYAVLYLAEIIREKK